MNFPGLLIRLAPTRGYFRALHEIPGIAAFAAISCFILDDNTNVDDTQIINAAIKDHYLDYGIKIARGLKTLLT